MINTEVKLAPYAKLIVFTVLLGVVSACVTFAFMSLTHLGAYVLWVQAAETLGVDQRVFTLLVCTAGGLFMRSLRALQQLFAPMRQRVVLCGLPGGLAMGIVGALLPLTLFSGEEAIVRLIAQATELGIGMLIVLGVVKVLVTSLLLATGWKGGYIFPIMFGSVAIGLAANLLVPAIPVAVAVAATMSGALVTALRAPLFAALFTLALVQRETVPDIAMRDEALRLTSQSIGL